MGRTLSPMLQKEFENLEKDSASRRSAMKALKSYVKDLDSKAIPIFLAQVSETKQTGLSSSSEYTISLYEVLARVHGPKIIPQIDNIMTTIIKTLSSTTGSFALHQACSKVVPAIAKYGVDPTSIDDKKRSVIHSLCKPLSDCLLCSQENLSCGVALCLQALVESDNWRFASNEMVNEVCQRVTGSLEKHSQTNPHMALVTALAKHNSLLLEAYARLLVQSGMRILRVGFAESNSQKQLSAIHMVSSLMKCLDPKSLISEMEFVVIELDKCQSDSDRMPFVTGAAFEALQIAKRMCLEKGSKYNRRSVCNSPTSPESQTVDNSFVGFVESPVSMNRSVSRKLWRNGGVDVSLKDGIFSAVSRGSDNVDSKFSDGGDYSENFAGFVQGNGGYGVARSSNPSPQRSNSHININNLRLFTTPRKLVRSLQDPDDCDSCYSAKQTTRFETSIQSMFRPNHLQNGTKHSDENSSFSGEQQFHGNSESVSSTDDLFLAGANVEVSDEVTHGNEVQIKNSIDADQGHKYMGRNIAFGIFVVLFAVMISCLLVIGDWEDHHVLVPT